MKVTALVDNKTDMPGLIAVHGLSFYIETGSHRILFDLGPGEACEQNAEVLGIDLEVTDTVVISHGHDDHGGGLRTFLAVNKVATIYVQEEAFDEYYVHLPRITEYIGLDRQLEMHGQIVRTSGVCYIDSSLTVFSGVSETHLQPSANHSLYKKTGNGMERDIFDHEQHLIVREEDRYYLFAGCAHSGIMNIVERAETLCGKQMSAVFSGFHLYNPDTGETESEVAISALAGALQERETKYYTCHCTGEVGYARLRELMGEQIGYIAAGVCIREG